MKTNLLIISSFLVLLCSCSDESSFIDQNVLIEEPALEFNKTIYELNEVTKDFLSLETGRKLVYSILGNPKTLEAIEGFAKANNLNYHLDEVYILSFEGSLVQNVVIPTTLNDVESEKIDLVFVLESPFIVGQPMSVMGGFFLKSSTDPLGVNINLYNIDYYDLHGDILARTTYDYNSNITVATYVNLDKGWWDDFTGCLGNYISWFAEGGVGSVAGVGCMAVSAQCAVGLAIGCAGNATIANWCGSCGTVCYSCIPHP